MANVDSEKSSGTKRPSARAKPEQIEKIQQFMKAKDEQWNNLITELNNIAPQHSSVEWKRIWSVHKHYSKKQKGIDASEKGESSHSTTSHQIEIEDEERDQFLYSTTSDQLEVEDDDRYQPTHSSISDQVVIVDDGGGDKIVEVFDKDSLMSCIHQILEKLDYIIERLDV